MIWTKKIILVKIFVCNEKQWVYKIAENTETKVKIIGKLSDFKKKSSTKKKKLKEIKLSIRPTLILSLKGSLRIFIKAMSPVKNDVNK